MRINGENYPLLSVFQTMMTVPDCIVVGSNKIGGGHGEKKFYIASKQEMYSFYGNEGFVANCFMLKTDLIAYMNAVKNEYLNPSQNYAKKSALPRLWGERMQKILQQEDVISFRIIDQNQIAGPRGYINSDDEGYNLIREVSLPLVSYICAEKLGTEDNPIFYWKLFVDFDAIWQKQSQPLVFTYGRRNGDLIIASPSEEESIQNTPHQTELRNARVGQGKYREKLLEQCPFCPITMISDERLLIASHIKPWAASDDNEKIDPYNGYMLSPMIDKLFDKGFITFDKDRHMILSEFISSRTWSLMALRNNTFYQSLPMDEKREEYLNFHHEAVFKGTYEAS